MMCLGVMCTNNLEMFMFASILLSPIDSSFIMPAISQRNFFFGIFDNINLEYESIW